MDRLTASQRKAIAALSGNSARRESGLFRAEGTRCVTDMLPHMNCRHLLATAQWIADNPAWAGHPALMQVTSADIARMSSQQTPQPVIGVFEIPDHQAPVVDGSSLVLALDSVQNPGNLGTIIRLADWFGITDIIASRGTADAFGSKVVQATMGALVRVRVTYVDDLAGWLEAAEVPVAGTFLDGRDLYAADDLPLSPAPIVVMGNEGSGISPEVEAVVSHRLLIPSFPPGRQTSESLNVAMATGIVVSELTRRIHSNG